MKSALVPVWQKTGDGLAVMSRSFYRAFFRILFRGLARIDVHGSENIPPEEACLLTSNHLGIVDAPLVFTILNRDDATGLVALKHKGNPFLRWLVSQVDGIWIDRDHPDLRALKEAHNYLKNGWLVGIAPEGTRSATHALIEAKPGVAFLADKMESVIVPVGIAGTENSLKKMLTLQRPRFTVNIGEPFSLPHIDRENREIAFQNNTEEIMCRIAALLPPQYRGFYSDHPRLKDLLDDSL
jgi:1-acyl-sn-glycerol-3-phosphate acyltransferase